MKELHRRSGRAAQAVQDATSLEEVVEAHACFLDAALQQCFCIQDRTWQLIADAVHRILDLGLVFSRLAPLLSATVPTLSLSPFSPTPPYLRAWPLCCLPPLSPTFLRTWSHFCLPQSARPHTPSPHACLRVWSHLCLPLSSPTCPPLRVFARLASVPQSKHKTHPPPGLHYTPYPRAPSGEIFPALPLPLRLPPFPPPPPGCQPRYWSPSHPSQLQYTFGMQRLHLRKRYQPCLFANMKRM